MQKYIIINADDYGLSPLFNKGILELAQKNIISSISVMIKRKYANTKELKNLKNISLGLHLELQEKDTQKEIESQLKKFKTKLGQLPSHLDGHKHLHLTKHNLPLVIKIAKKYKLPVRSHLDKDHMILKKSGIKTPDIFISWHPKRREKLFKKLAEIKQKKAELVCHPGYCDKKLKLSYNKQREEELQTLKSRRFKKILNNFKLINYNEI